MDQKTKDRIEKMVKSLYKSVGKKKAADVISDVLDNNRIAEVPSDEEAPDKTGTLNKSKKKKLKKCDDKENCDCECGSPADFEKGEKFVKDMLGNFEVISKAYLKKKELEKARVDEFEPNASAKRKARRERGNPGMKSRALKPSSDPRAFKPHRKEKFSEGGREFPKTPSSASTKKRLQAKYGKQPKKEDLAYPSLAASEGKKQDS